MSGAFARVDREFTIGALQDLVRIDSRNPDLEAGAPGEGPLARHLETVLGRIGWTCECYDAAPGRPNVVAVRRGAGGGPSLMLNVHMDTVGTAGMADPFAGELRDGRVLGRGAQDTKGGLAAVLGAAKALADANARLRGDLVLAFVADEESLSVGSADVARRHRTDAAIVLEPSDLDVCVAHRGFGVFRVATTGRIAHGGRPDLGVDANRLMGRVLTGLDGLQAAWSAEPGHPLLGTPSLHVPLLRGGQQRFIYAGECVAEVECRTVPGQTEASVRAALQGVLDAAAAADGAFSATLEPALWRSAWEIDPSRPIVGTVRSAVAAVRGAAPAVIGHGWWEDSALLGEAGIETVVIGPIGGGLHTAVEWVDAASVVDLAEILRRSALAHCGES
ncbi:MAG: M20/M25/M40 family metallo-hydrolase [Candidatus Krumholzibacteriia bacterium]